MTQVGYTVTATNSWIVPDKRTETWKRGAPGDPSTASKFADIRQEPLLMAFLANERGQEWAD